MRPGARSALFFTVSAIVVFTAGLSVGLWYGGHAGLRWNYDLGWQPIATLAAAVLNCITIIAVAWAITTRLQQHQSDKAFDRELIMGFVRSALVSSTRIHEYLASCRQENVFTEKERQGFVVLFTALGQDLQLIQDTLEVMEIKASAIEAAQRCRSEYKDLLTDRAPGSVFGLEDERSEVIKHREIRRHLIELVVQVNREYSHARATAE
jgi:hypothetical protein